MEMQRERSRIKKLPYLDDLLFEIINEKEIVERLKEYTNVSHIKLPRDIDFTIKNGILKVFCNRNRKDGKTN